MEERTASQPHRPGALARHVPGIMLRVSSGAGDYSQTFTARARTDVLDLLDGIRFLSAALVRRTLEGNDLAQQLRAHGHRTQSVYPDRSLYAVLACEEEGAELSDEMLDIIFRRTLTDRGDSQVHRDRQAAVKIIAGLKDDLRWIDARLEGFSTHLGPAVPPAETSSGVFRDLLSSALSSDPGNTTVHLGGCYVSPILELLEAVESGTADGALAPLVQQVVAMEEALASHARSMDGSTAAVNPVRIIGSLPELESLAADSVISSPWQPSSIYQHDGNGIWSEPGTEEALPAEAVWELMTGSDSGIVLDEDRSVWVLYDAAKSVPTPGPANPEHRYLTMANAGRGERFIAHSTLSEARAAIEELCALPGGAPAHLAIRYRTEAATVFRGITPIQPGTIPEDLPWNQPA